MQSDFNTLQESHSSVTEQWTKFFLSNLPKTVRVKKQVSAVTPGMMDAAEYKLTDRLQYIQYNTTQKITPKGNSYFSLAVS